MRNSRKPLYMIPVYITVIACFIACAYIFNKSVTVMAENKHLENRKCVIIDAGHGGIDGGATSCTGVLESKLNLDVALRTNDVLHLLGIKTRMIRTKDISIYTEGQSVAAKKMSDLKERVRIVNETDDAILISIHMNQFSQNRYHGPQVFYGEAEGSKELAERMQIALNVCVDPDSKRFIKKADGIYLMEHINKCGILVECGFLSNPEEEANLRSAEYQKKLSGVIAVTVMSYMYDT